MHFVVPRIFGLGLLLSLFLASVGPVASAERRPKINLQVRQADLRDVFIIIARFARVNVLLSREVKGKISLELVGVDYLRAMDAIARLNGYEILLKDGIVCIGDEDAIRRVRGQGVSEVLTLNHADPEAMAKLLRKVHKDLEVMTDPRTNSIVIVPR